MSRPTRRRPPMDWRELLVVREELQGLAAMFESLDGSPRLSPWSPLTLDRWGAKQPEGSAARHAVAFLMAVWNPDEPWACAPFDMHEALAIWTNEDRMAFLYWAANPFWGTIGFADGPPTFSPEREAELSAIEGELVEGHRKLINDVLASIAAERGGEVPN